MINANEIRIGNLIRCEDGKIRTISSIDESAISTKEDGNKYMICNITGVELNYSSYEMIERTGMFICCHIPNHPGECLINHSLILSFPTSESVQLINVHKIGRFDEKLGYVCVRSVDRLHELQNAIFLCSGKELFIDKNELR